MAISALIRPHPTDFFEDTRRRLLTNLHIQPKVREPGRAVGDCPKVVFIDRSATNRHLVRKDREALLELLRRWDRSGRISFVLAQLEGMSHDQQVEAVADADVSSSIPFGQASELTLQIILGVHGNGLTHQLWMPPGAVVIEVSTYSRSSVF